MYVDLATKVGGNILPEINAILTGAIAHPSDFDDTRVNVAATKVSLGSGGLPAWELVWQDTPDMPTSCVWRSGTNFLQISHTYWIIPVASYNAPSNTTVWGLRIVMGKQHANGVLSETTTVFKKAITYISSWTYYTTSEFISPHGYNFYYETTMHCIFNYNTLSSYPDVFVDDELLVSASSTHVLITSVPGPVSQSFPYFPSNLPHFIVKEEDLAAVEQGRLWFPSEFVAAAITELGPCTFCTSTGAKLADQPLNQYKYQSPILWTTNRLARLPIVFLDGNPPLNISPSTGLWKTNDGSWDAKFLAIPGWRIIGTGAGNSRYLLQE